MQYRFKIARYIDKGDRLLVCSIWYVVELAIDREVGGEPKYRQLLLSVEGAAKSDHTELIMLYPLGALVKVKSAIKT